MFMFTKNINIFDHPWMFQSLLYILPPKKIELKS